MQEERKESWWVSRLRTPFITGLFVVVPIGASILILVSIFNYIDRILGPVVTYIWGERIPGIGFAVTIVVTYLIGLFASNVLGREMVHFAEAQLAKVPIFRQLYVGIKQIVNSFSLSQSGKTGFMQVVLVEFPRKGMKAIGFITNELTDHKGEKLYSVFIPTAPNPVSGFLQILQEEEIVRTRISVDDALKMVVSAGSITPPSVGARWPQ